MSHQTDTIAAIATPPGEGGIAIIRVSGPDAMMIADTCLRRTGAACNPKSRRLYNAILVDPEKNEVDEVLFAMFKGPGSYTGEDVLEIHCHGGMLVSKRVLEVVLMGGVRHAEPGEFTKRAYLNGKMDLSQAEAVAELIHATSDRAHRTSLAHLKGEFSSHIKRTRQALIDAVGLLELELDFAEDGYELVNKGDVERLVLSARESIKELIDSHSRGKIIREGVNTVLVGAPNVGKSSLMNRLLRESRAIVTEVPGTTRDVISENITIGGILFKLSDTAGIRRSQDMIEQEGVRRSREKLSTADIILLVLDVSGGLEEQLEEIGEETVKVLVENPSSVQIVFNKTDLNREVPPLPKRLQRPASRKIYCVSAKTGMGVSMLEEGLLECVPGFGGSAGPEGSIVTSVRHYEVFLRVAESLDLALSTLREGRTGEFMAVDLRAALDGLGEIIGEVPTEEILNNVFARFCIGK